VNLHDSFGPGLRNLQQAPGLSKLIAATISSDRTGAGVQKATGQAQAFTTHLIWRRINLLWWSSRFPDDRVFFGMAIALKRSREARSTDG